MDERSILSGKTREEQQADVLYQGLESLWSTIKISVVLVALVLAAMFAHSYFVTWPRDAAEKASYEAKMRADGYVPGQMIGTGTKKPSKLTIGSSCTGTTGR